jgi:tetratricopeptide (TPR) repeat protein
MASLIPGYEYDIFISYRQKDNKYDGWVTGFVENLQRELEATFKEDVSVYFDINPHDGLLETHDVDASLREKLKCLIFIPIISRTYCDPKSFAWEHEFVAFAEQASKDKFGLKVKLPDGNVANRILPVRIHDLDIDDTNLCESILGGVLRGIEFIYKEPGVNKPLTPEDDEKKNINKTKYRIQINKIANAIKEIVSGLMSWEAVSGKEKTEPLLPWEEAKKETRIISEEQRRGFNKSTVLLSIISTAIILALLGLIVYPKIFKRNTIEKLRSSGEKISVAVMPFQNMTHDTLFNYWQELIQSSLISSLSNTGELRVRQQDNINTFLKTNGTNELASISPSTAGAVSIKLEADIFINGNIQKAGSMIRISAQLIDTKTMEVLKSFELNGPYDDSIIITISDSLIKKVTNFLLISKLIKENLVIQHLAASTNSPEALKYYVYGFNANKKWDLPTAREFYLKALEIDSNYLDPMVALFDCDQAMGLMEQSLQILLQMHRKRDQWSPVQKLWADWSYATSFESPDEQIKYIRQLQQIDDKRVDLPLIIGSVYNSKKEYNKAIPELEKGLELWQNTGWREYFKGNSAVFVELGKAYHNTSQYEKEKKLYKIAEPDCPNDLPLILRQTSLALTEKDSISTNRYIEKYKSIIKGYFSSEKDIAFRMAQMYSEIGMIDKAEEYYRKAISLDPDNPALLNGFAYFIRENKRNIDEFISIINKALSLAPNKYEYYNYLDTKGYGLYKFGRSKEALEILQKTWDETPFKMYFIKSHYDEVKKAVASQK